MSNKSKKESKIVNKEKTSLSDKLKKMSDNNIKRNALIEDIPMQITVELGRQTLTVKQLENLSQGSVIELEEYAGEPLTILINNQPIGTGEVVVVNDKFGIRILDILD